MHEKVIFDGELLFAQEAKIPALSSAVLYGQSVFTTLAIYNRRPFMWNEHWARLKTHAERVGIKHIDTMESLIINSLNRLIETNFIGNGKARITLFANNNPGAWQLSYNELPRISFLITTGNASDILNDKTVITISSKIINTRLPLTGIKSSNYLENILALEEAHKEEFQEAVRINEKGEVVSACMANIFWVKDGELFTPDLATGALKGTTRDFVVKLAEEFSIRLHFVQNEISAVANADEIFLTSSGIGVCIVRRIDSRFIIYKPKSLAIHLREAFRKVTMKN